MRPDVRRSAIFMDTTVTIEVTSPEDSNAAVEAIARSFHWFERVEAVCSRFDPASELRALMRQPRGTPVVVSPLLFEPLAFALALAEETGGAFDPTVGAALEAAGFDRNYRTGASERSGIAPGAGSYRDVTLDRTLRSVTRHRPLVLELGAVAKGFAIDLAARELAGFAGYAVFAGGDLYVHAPAERPFSIGIRHPRKAGELLAVLSVHDGAVCTSGDYERFTAGGHHLFDARARANPTLLASVTVIAPNAMLADGLSTSAFAMGPTDGLELLSANGVDGLAATGSLQCFTTPDFWSRFR